VKDPARSITRATFSGIALVTLIYVLMNVAFLQVLTPAEMAGSPLVAADAAARVFGPSADTFVTAISLISRLTILNMALMTLPRAIFAMARDRGVAGLSHVAKNGTPIGAVILMTSASALMATVGVYEILLAFSVTLTTTVAACINIAAITLRRREPDLERPYRMPLFPLPAIFSLLVNGGLLIAFLYEGPAISLQAYALLAVVTTAVLILTRRTAAQAEG
jgi:APA family basic amino acid/polyamine antiporter